jgi:hypothetical protein
MSKPHDILIYSTRGAEQMAKSTYFELTDEDKAYFTDLDERARKLEQELREEDPLYDSLDLPTKVDRVLTKLGFQRIKPRS